MILFFSNSKALGMVETISATDVAGKLHHRDPAFEALCINDGNRLYACGVFMAFLGTTINLILITEPGSCFFVHCHTSIQAQM